MSLTHPGPVGRFEARYLGPNCIEVNDGYSGRRLATTIQFIFFAAAGAGRTFQRTIRPKHKDPNP